MGLLQVRVVSAGGESNTVLTASAPSVSLSAGGGAGSAIVAYLREGVAHIWTGVDHVLFLLSLLLPAVLVRARRGGRETWAPADGFRPAFVDVAKIVTAFTLAHSITLTLAALSWVEPPSRWVESAIALSVVVVSVGYVSGGRLATRIGTWAATGWAVAIAGLVLLPFSAGALRALPAAPLPGLWAMAFLVIGVTIIGYACWYYAIGVASPQRIAPLQFGQPVISLVIAVALLAEPLTPAILMATALILTGVVLCRRAVS